WAESWPQRLAPAVARYVDKSLRSCSHPSRHPLGDDEQLPGPNRRLILPKRHRASACHSDHEHFDLGIDVDRYLLAGLQSDDIHGEIVAEVRPADPRLASRGERRHVNYA